MVEDNIRVEIRICSYHIGEICGIPTIYLTDPPIEGEPTCELVKKTRIDDRIICSTKKKNVDFDVLNG